MQIPTSCSPSANGSTSTTPTLATALAAIDTWTDLPPARRHLLKVSLNGIAAMLGDPTALIVLTPQLVRTRLLAHPPSAFGIGEGTMRNRRSHLKQVMVRLKVLDACEAPVSPAWQALLAPLDSREKAPLAKLVDYCAANAIEPADVSTDLLSDFASWLELRTLTANPKTLLGSCRRAWNRFSRSQPGWPAILLPAPSDTHQYILPLGSFTPAFRESLAGFAERLARLGTEDPFSDENWSSEVSPAPSAPGSGGTRGGVGLRPISIDARVRQARWAASALVVSGKARIEEINSVNDLVEPSERARAIMRYLYQLRGGERWAGALHVWEVLLILAKYEAKRPQPEIDALRKLRRLLSPTSRAMSPRRRNRLLEVMAPERLAALLALPGACMQQALKLLPHAPHDATSLAMRAVAVQMLLTTQLRLKNLIQMKIGQHLQGDDPARKRYNRFDIAEKDTKNNRPLSRPIGGTTRAMMDTWIRHFRPHLANDRDGYLFPGHRGTPHITAQGFRDAIKGVTGRVCGVALTPHDFRGLAGKIHLAYNKGDFGTVMYLLGHGALPTTIDYYTADELDGAAADYDRLVLGLTEGKLALPGTKGHKPKSQGKRAPKPVSGPSRNRRQC